MKITTRTVSLHPTTPMCRRCHKHSMPWKSQTVKWRRKQRRRKRQRNQRGAKNRLNRDGTHPIRQTRKQRKTVNPTIRFRTDDLVWSGTDEVLVSSPIRESDRTFCLSLLHHHRHHNLLVQHLESSAILDLDLGTRFAGIASVRFDLANNIQTGRDLSKHGVLTTTRERNWYDRRKHNKHNNSNNKRQRKELSVGNSIKRPTNERAIKRRANPYTAKSIDRWMEDWVDIAFCPHKRTSTSYSL